ncbi:hypothetical protein PISL3812_07181 [Talaromyces islandicus]|uniref:Azaphilone pigments biosynthesis cluster protein L N-terminal domain-containing protein n=1 Tax=Talaromyces islandicus TaxID=28573 RepID=A0A0U1M3I8_TALIS|nr:hypothetical protein PISL3812_07181 [Talaromyces islandicus]
MTDPLSVTTSLIALTGFAYRTSKSLYQAVDSFQSSKRIIRELREEVISLNQVLETLAQMAVKYGEQLDNLKLPLLRCGKACQEFEETINKCVAHAGSEKKSFRDWVQLQWRGGNIADLKTTLAGYKSTINIAIGGATFRQAAVTTNVLDEYRKMIDEASSDLQEHLALIDERMRSLLAQKGSQVEYAPEVEEIKKEKEGIGQCLAICSEVSELIEGFQSRQLPTEYSSSHASSRNTHFFPSATTTTNKLLAEFKEKLSMNHQNLKSRLFELENQLQNQKGEEPSLHDKATLKAMKEERDSIDQCLKICTEASDLTTTVRTNVFENVASADNAHQLVVSTIGELISAKYVTTGSNSIQWLGQMSDETLQKLSGDHKHFVNERTSGPVPTEKDGFRHRYGAGRQLDKEDASRHQAASNSDR